MVAFALARRVGMFLDAPPCGTRIGRRERLRPPAAAAERQRDAHQGDHDPSVRCRDGAIHGNKRPTRLSPSLFQACGLECVRMRPGRPLGRVDHLKHVLTNLASTLIAGFCERFDGPGGKSRPRAARLTPRNPARSTTRKGLETLGFGHRPARPCAKSHLGDLNPGPTLYESAGPPRLTIATTKSCAKCRRTSRSTAQRNSATSPTPTSNA